jgi:dipeptidyl-peptidase-4
VASVTAGRRPDGPAASFPRRYARTQRFTLGAPRGFTVAAGGRRILFLRSTAGDDPVQHLWILELPEGRERCLAAPAQLHAHGDEELAAEERARRERVRESASGIVAYAIDREATVAAFALGRRLFAIDVATGAARVLPTEQAVVDPRPDPTGRRVAYVHGGALRVAELDDGASRTLVAEEAPGVTWGLAEFVAAEEMGRTRGYWWAPDGERLAVTRVDTGPVARWHVTDPSEPAREPVTLAYPVAGGANAHVELAIVALDGARVPVAWDTVAFEYLVDVIWDETGPLTLVVQSRDQRTVAVLAADPDSGHTRLIAEQRDEQWVDIVPGVPRWLPGGRLVWTIDDTDTRRLAIDGVPVTPIGLQVRRVVDVGEHGVVFTASANDPAAVTVWHVAAGGSGHLKRLSTEDGVADAAAGGGVIVIQSRSLSDADTRTVISGHGLHLEVASFAETPGLRPRPALERLSRRALCSALLLPSGFTEGDGGLPVLLDPYGGPHAQRVLRRADAYLTSQWFADQGFAVLVIDGRGTPGRGPRWEREVAGDLGDAPLEDQVDALHAAAGLHPTLDLSRVAIRGWSFGGYLAALAVLRRPDVFAAAIAGAPVTDWRLYDTHYTERYLGQPADNRATYEHSSLLADAARLERPLLLIHGLADDNVVAAHTLRLSRALLEAGRPHSVLPLSGVTHMTSQEVVAENLLRLQLAFLRDALGLAGPEEPGPRIARAKVTATRDTRWGTGADPP